MNANVIVSPLPVESTAKCAVCGAHGSHKLVRRTSMTSVTTIACPMHWTWAVACESARTTDEIDDAFRIRRLYLELAWFGRKVQLVNPGMLFGLRDMIEDEYGNLFDRAISEDLEHLGENP